MFKILNLGGSPPKYYRVYYYNTRTKKYGQADVQSDGKVRELGYAVEIRDYEHLWAMIGKFDPYANFKFWEYCPDITSLTYAKVDDVAPMFRDGWVPPVIIPTREAALPMRAQNVRTTFYLQVSTQCLSCAHFNPDYGLACKAFPDGIPKLIHEGRWDHNKKLPVGQDNDIVFKLRPDLKKGGK